MGQDGSPISDATPNTGSGGGGNGGYTGSVTDAKRTGGDGGAGIVIVRYDTGLT
jgi:hypothetical protein